MTLIKFEHVAADLAHKCFTFSSEGFRRGLNVHLDLHGLDVQGFTDVG